MMNLSFPLFKTPEIVLFDDVRSKGTMSEILAKYILKQKNLINQKFIN